MADLQWAHDTVQSSQRLHDLGPALILQLLVKLPCMQGHHMLVQQVRVLPAR